MAAAEDKEKEGEATEEAPKKSKKMLFIIIGAVVLVAIIGGVAAMMLGGKKGGEGEVSKIEEEAHKDVHYQTAQLDTFIVNLSESTSFLKVTMLLEYDPSVLDRTSDKGGSSGGGGHGGGGAEKGGGGGALPALLVQREPMVKDAIIRVLSSKTTQEVLSTEGKEKLKEELIEAINEAIGLEEPPVVNIYFVEFVVQ